LPFAIVAAIMGELEGPINEFTTDSLLSRARRSEQGGRFPPVATARLTIRLVHPIG